MNVPLIGHDFEQVRRFARTSTLNGRSAVRGSERAARGFADQMIGRAGEAAWSIAAYGSIYPFVSMREAQDEDPWKGDGGSDDPKGLMVDIKTSRRSPKLAPHRHRLLVRPAERHTGVNYVLALAEIGKRSAMVQFIGWAAESELPSEPQPDDAPYGFGGAYLVNGHELRPFDPRDVRGY